MTCRFDKTIVVPIDFSDESRSALDVAMELAESPSQLHVIHVIEDTATHISDIPVGKAKHDVRVRREKKHLYDEFADHECNGVRLQTCFGDPGSKLSNMLSTSIRRSDYYAVARSRRTNPPVDWFGSAERVVRLAHCPVLIRKSPKCCTGLTSESAAEVALAGHSNLDGNVPHIDNQSQEFANWLTKSRRSARDRRTTPEFGDLR